MISEKSSIKRLIDQSFYTKAEFNVLLQDYAVQHGLDGIFFKVTKKHEKINEPYFYTYGTELRDQPIKAQKEIDVVDSSVKIHYFIWAQQNVASETEEEVLEIIKKHLDFQNMYRSTLLPSYEHPHEDKWLDKKLEATVKRFLEAGMSAAVFMIDLDHFKDVNDQNNHDVGGSVLFEFSNLLTSCCEEKAVVVHRSGDEFFVIMPYCNSFEPIELAYRIRNAAKNHSYKNISQHINLTAAQGICLLTDHKISFKDAVLYAEKAYKPDGQEKHRDSVRIVCPSEPEHAPRKEPSDYDLAYVVVCSRLTDQSVFHNPYLDFISFMSSQCESVNGVQEQINQWLSWIHPDEILGMQLLNLSSDESFACGWSSEELAFALFHGLCRNPINAGKCISLSFDLDKSNSFSISVDCKPVYLCGETFKESKDRSYAVSLPDCAIAECAVRNTVLIHIGYDPLIIPDCFYRVIRIDARPFTGGNLPDFWAGALSELIDLMAEETCVRQVIVYGDINSAKKIYEILTNIENWGKEKYSLSFLSKQTKQPVMSIEACKERLTGHITFVAEKDKKGLIQALKQMCGPLEKMSLTKGKQDCHRFLGRTLPYEPISLKIEDGCTVKTMEEAFPTVLEIIRNCKSAKVMTDQARRELKELTNFKLTITRPRSTSIPEYYLEQVDDLEAYYQSVLGNRDSFFQKELEKGNQYQAVLQHVADLIGSTKLKYASRRALLVVPHQVTDQKDISPYGLVSVYISPRETVDGIVFNFSFTWRTVEAVVGLPYSLYGSVKYAEHLLDEIKERLSGAQTPALKMGHVSYMAYSLHMFLDSPYAEIVRGIINDATI